MRKVYANRTMRKMTKSLGLNGYAPVNRQIGGVRKKIS